MMPTMSPLSSTVLGSGPPVVLAHGAGGSVQMNFGPVMAQLGRRFRVIGGDYPGSGQTPRATGVLDLDELADRLVATAVDAGAEQFALVGHSLGSAVAVRATTRHPDRVTRLVLSSGFACLDASTRETVERWRVLAAGDRLALARFVLSVVLSEAIHDGLSDLEREGFVELVAATTAPGLIEQIDLALEVDVRPDLAKVAVPTLVVGGELDRLVSMELTRELALGITGAHWATLRSGHAPALETAREWLGLIEDFLV